MKIDIYNHIMPKAYVDIMMKVAPNHADLGKRIRGIPMLVDLDERFRVMDLFGDDYRQILSIPGPPAEILAGPDVSPDLSRAANDGMAELVGKYPDRFPGFTARMPMNNPKAALAELHRAIRDLGAKGIGDRVGRRPTPISVGEGCCSLLPIPGQQAPRMAFAQSEHSCSVSHRHVAGHHLIQYLEPCLFVCGQCQSSHD